MKTEIEPFSDQYFLLPDVEPVEWPRERIVVPKDLFDQMRQRVRDPVLKLSNGHYRPAPEHGVPAETVAVPVQMSVDPEEKVLLAKDDSVGELMVDDVARKDNAPSQ